MKAIVWTAYGSPDRLQIRDIATPVPQPGAVLIRVHAATVLAGDCELRRAQFPTLLWIPLRLLTGVTRPRDKVLGQAPRFEPGDESRSQTVMPPERRGTTP
jgi:NADPH:quinone reductase-like Zn-dependent oxidoreductase